MEGLEATVGASNQMKLLHGASSNIEGASDEVVEGLKTTIEASIQIKLLNGSLV